MASLATLRLGVGALLGTTISATSIPTQTQVDEWLLECAYKICDKAHEMHLDKNFVRDSSTIPIATDEIDISGVTRYCRTVAFGVNLDPTSTNVFVPATEVSPSKFAVLQNTQSVEPFYKGDYQAPLYCIIGTNIEFDPASQNNSATYSHVYIQYPTDASGMDDKWANLMMDYTAMMAELQDEELVDAQIFGQIFEKNWGSYRGL